MNGRSSARAAAAALVLIGSTACGAKPTPSSSGASGEHFKACMVGNELGDHSFDDESWAGMQAAAKADASIEVHYAASPTENDYASDIAGFISAGCKLIVTVGFPFNDATVASAKKNPGQHYAIVDNASTPQQVKGVQFNTAQGAFLGGYFAAGMTKTGKVATFGGANLPPVTVYMDGFWEGVQYYNQKHNTHMQVLGWDETKQQGTFDPTQSFTDQAGGKQIAATFQSEGADIVFPVAGGTGIGALTQAQSSGGKLNAIWVDDDGFYSNPQFGSVIMTSVVKGIATAVSTVVQQAAHGQFSAASYIGTLADNGTGLAPYHDFATKVPGPLTDEIDAVKRDLINGTIKIQSKNQPTS